MEGRNLINIHNGSLQQTLSAVYPEYEWLPWKFARSPQKYWSEKKNQRKFMEHAGKELGIKDMSDWYKVSIKV